MHNVIHDISIPSVDNETLVIEITNKIHFAASKRPPNDKIKPFKTHLKKILAETKSFSLSEITILIA